MIAGAVITCGCGARTLYENGPDGVDDARANGDALTLPDGSATTPAPPVPRTLKEFTAGVVGVWEGTVSSDVGGLVLPASRVRLEFAADGAFIGTCLAPDPRSSSSCSPLPNVWEGRAPGRTWSVHRLTAGYEGMGEVREPSHGRDQLHRMRLSGDEQSLDFDVIYADDGDIVLNYRLRKVAR